MNRDIVISFSLAAGLGAVIWAVSPVVTGSAEPWDAESPYYFVSLFTAGAIVGFLYPVHILSEFSGIVAGQLIYLLVFLPSGPLLPLGVIFLVGFGLVSLLGAFLASRTRRRPESISTGGGHGT